jgi:phage gp46-like protein
MKDIMIYETGNGGDMKITNSDLTLTEGLSQQVYLRLFGGNIEASTKGDELENQVRFDWWANSLHLKNLKTRQFNSETEATLNNTALNSAGRIKIIRAVENDLSSMKNIANISVDVSLNSVNKLTIFVKIKQPENQDDKILKILWDNLKRQAIIDSDI